MIHTRRRCSRRSTVGLAVAVVTLSTLLAACGSSSGAGAAGTTSPEQIAAAKGVADQYLKAPTTITQNVPLPKAPPAGKSIVFLGDSNPDTTKIGQGIETAAKAIGWKFSTVSFDTANPATLQAAFDTALQRHPDYVAEAGIAQTQISAQVIDAYKGAGVPIILSEVEPLTVTDTILGPAGDGEMTTLQGKTLANWFVADSGGTGSAVIESVSAYPVLTAFVDSFVSTVNQTCPGCHVTKLGVSVSQLQQGKLISAVVSKLRSDPSLKYVFFDQYEFASGINSALAAAGLQGIKIGGNGFGAEPAAALRNGTQNAWSVYSPYYNGYQVIDVAVRHATGVPVTTNNAVLPTQILTKENVGDRKDTWNEPNDALAQFEKLWQVPTTPCSLGCS